MYTSEYLLNPIYPINITVIGVGGTGSFVVPELASLSVTLKELGHPGFNITIFDNDIVEEHNIGRQKYYKSDIGLYKANVLATRINRAYGTNIVSACQKWDGIKDFTENIIISCVDNVKTRKTINNKFKDIIHKDNRFNLFYWIDLGNNKDTGQIILKSYLEKDKNKTKSIIELFPDIKDSKEKKSCSVALSLSKQSFMINKILGAYSIQLLSNMFIDFQIPFTQFYLNLLNFKTKIF